MNSHMRKLRMQLVRIRLSHWGSGICGGEIPDAQSDSTAYSALEKAFVPCFENSAPGARGAGCKPKGSVCAEAENFSAHAYVYKNQE